MPPKLTLAVLLKLALVLGVPPKLMPVRPPKPPSLGLGAPLKLMLAPLWKLAAAPAPLLKSMLVLASAFSWALASISNENLLQA